MAIVAPLVTALEARAYAAPGEEIMAPPAGPVIDALRAASPWWRRVVAVVAPVSLTDREPDDARVLIGASEISAP